MPAPLRFSVLDRSLVRHGVDAGESLRRTVAFAREVEALGFHRFWVAEHHGVPGIAGSAPTVLAAAIAAATERIRVGTGGVMLPNHRPLVVAEQFGVLESLFPGRIDMGLGRSLGFTKPLRDVLGSHKEDAERFADDLRELLGYFAGRAGVRAVPSRGLDVPAFVLATGSGADVAADLGLPLVIAGVRGDDALVQTIDRYRDRFVASRQAAEPYVVVSRHVAVADSTEEARRLLVPEAWSAAHSRVHGVFPPLEPANDVLGRSMEERERQHFERAMNGHVFGTLDEVADRLTDLVDATGADELLVSTSAHDQAGLLDSHRRLATLIPAVT